MQLSAVDSPKATRRPYRILTGTALAFLLILTAFYGCGAILRGALVKPSSSRNVDVQLQKLTIASTSFMAEVAITNRAACDHIVSCDSVESLIAWGTFVDGYNRAWYFDSRIGPNPPPSLSTAAMAQDDLLLTPGECQVVQIRMFPQRVGFAPVIGFWESKPDHLDYCFQEQIEIDGLHHPVTVKGSVAVEWK